jgi:pimeloyl-ACP methyl ester carboxylesterase
MLYTSVHGNPSNPTIIFLHGGGGAGWMWQPQVDALQADYHILAPDLPEHGRSASIKPFSIAGSAEQVAELIRAQAHAGRAHVVGLSEGAQVAVALLAAAPELVDHAILSSALVHSMYGMDRFGAGLWIATYHSIEPLNKYDWWMRLNMKSNGIPLRFLPEMREIYQSMTAEAFGHVIAENQRFRLPAGLERVKVPTLVVGGWKEYKVMHQSIRDVASAIPGSQACLVHHTQKLSMPQEHNWSMNAPELFTHTLRAWMEDMPLPHEIMEMK